MEKALEMIQNKELLLIQDNTFGEIKLEAKIL